MYVHIYSVNNTLFSVIVTVAFTAILVPDVDNVAIKYSSPSAIVSDRVLRITLRETIPGLKITDTSVSSM
jgi:hypothetical protein